MEISYEVEEKLGSYVYKLIDPTDGKVFYIGKGQRDRVFSHIKEETKLEDSSDTDYVIPLKLGLIRSLKKRGLKPIHVIVRHGMSEHEAELVEAVLIQENSGLTNLVSGRGTDQFGSSTLEELIGRYSKEPLSLNSNHKILIIKIKEEKKSDLDVYEAVRKAWRVDVNRAKKADYIFAVTDSYVRGVFIANEWLPATKSNFPNLISDIPGRYGFNGKEVNIEEYKYKRLPDDFRGRQVGSSPVLYNYE